MRTPEEEPDEQPVEADDDDEDADDEQPYSRLDEETAARCGLWLDDE